MFLMNGKSNTSQEKIYSHLDQQHPPLIRDGIEAASYDPEFNKGRDHWGTGEKERQHANQPGYGLEWPGDPTEKEDGRGDKNNEHQCVYSFPEQETERKTCKRNRENIRNQHKIDSDKTSPVRK